MNNNRVCAVVVTFHPRAEHLKNLRAISSQVQSLVVVDNGSPEETIASLRRESIKTSSVLIENGANLGIAAAMNKGIRWAFEHAHDWVVFFDQDSSVTPGFISAMIAEFMEPRIPDNILQMIPRYFDPETGIEESIQVAADGGPFITRTAGSFFPLKAFQKCGLFSEELFIYCVDDDFSLRLRSMGYSIAQCSKAILKHSAGRPSRVRILGRSYVARNYRPEVQYYWARNRIWLVRKYGWRFPQIIYSSMRSIVGVPLKIAFGERDRRRKIQLFMRGLVDGLLGKTGCRLPIY